MKQGLLLIAIYALIINQAKKGNSQQQDIPDVVLKNMSQTISAAVIPVGQIRIARYAYLDQSAFLITSTDNRSFIMLEDGTCYEIVDHSNTPERQPDKNNIGYYSHAIYRY